MRRATRTTTTTAPPIEKYNPRAPPACHESQLSEEILLRIGPAVAVTQRRQERREREARHEAPKAGAEVSAAGAFLSEGSVWRKEQW